MADLLDDGEFWLPSSSRFLTEHDAFINSRGFSINRSAATEPAFCYGSDLGSPVESLSGSTENESDEDDMLADLSRNMARSTLDDGFSNSGDKFEERMYSRSPQSILRPSNLDLLCQAVGEVANRRLIEELFARKQISPASVPLKPPNSDAPRLAQNSVLYHQLLDYQIQQLKNQKLQMIMKQQQQRSDSSGPHLTCGRSTEYLTTRNGRPLGISPAAWPSLQHATPHQHSGSVLTAVFLGAPAGKRECAGTGVFLPRRAGPQPDMRKRPACSSPLLPAKVVQAVNLENVGPLSPHLPNGCNGGEASWNSRRNSVGAHPNRSVRYQPATTRPEIRLPQEWTY